MNDAITSEQRLAERRDDELCDRVVELRTLLVTAGVEGEYANKIVELLLKIIELKS